MKIGWRLLLYLSILVMTVSFCTGLLVPRGFAQSRSLAPTIAVNRIALMPLIKGRYGTSLAEALDAPLFMFSPDPGNVDEDADRVLTEYVHGKLDRIHGVKAVPLDKTIELFFSAPRDATKDTLRSLAQKTGEALNANIIMTGYVWKYKERIGGPRAASSPASVSFALALIETSNGRLLWRGRFEEKQRSLSENVLDVKAFLDRGGKWVTVEDLARHGVNEIFKNYPYR